MLQYTGRNYVECYDVLEETMLSAMIYWKKLCVADTLQALLLTMLHLQLMYSSICIFTNSFRLIISSVGLFVLQLHVYVHIYKLVLKPSQQDLLLKTLRAQLSN